MRTVLSLFLLFVVHQSASAFDYPYNRLEKLYAQEKSKCLEKARFYMKYFPENAAPYYFSSRIHFERAQEQSVARRKYNEISKSLTYARKFEKLDDTQMADHVEWDSLSASILTYTQSLLEELDQEELTSLSALLTKKLDRLDWLEPDVAEVEMADVKVTKNKEVLTSTKSGLIDGQYFGVPKGIELIESYSKVNEKKMLLLINEERKRMGMEPLEWEEDLAKAARYHAFDMASQDYFNHSSYDRLNGKLVHVTGTFDRIKKFYTGSFVNSENIAAGNEGADDTYRQWYNSKGHYENMFNSSSKKVGIGVFYDPSSTYGYYWVFCTAL